MRSLDEYWLRGEFAPAAGDRFIDVISPVTEEVIGRVRSVSAEDVDAAVTAAQTALNGDWAQWSVDERAALLSKVRDAISARAEEFARLQTWQMGAPIRSTRGSAQKALGNLDSNLRASNALPRQFLLPDPDGMTLVERRPIGVVAAITPWNSPLQFELDKVSAALLAGCTVVLKPAPETPFGAYLLAEIFADCGLPPGALAVVSGDSDVGGWLVNHPAVARVTFTGSTAVGRQIGEACGRRLARASLELGGKSAGVVLVDADLEAAARTLALSNFGNTGQACHALTRVLVPASRRDDFVAAVEKVAAGLTVGDPEQESTDLGPLVTEVQRARVERYIEQAQAAGARVALGGGRPDGLTRGWFVEPTMLIDVTPDMAVAKEEVFGPVMSVIDYHNEADVVAMANESEYGLGGGVFTQDPEYGLNIARAMHTGMVTVNGWGMTRSAPFGGVKASGTGREHGIFGLAESLEYHAIRIPDDEADRLRQTGIGTDPVLL